jgi:hypothetical protein
MIFRPNSQKNIIQDGELVTDMVLEWQLLSFVLFCFLPQTIILYYEPK